MLGKQNQQLCRSSCLFLLALVVSSWTGAVVAAATLDVEAAECINEEATGTTSNGTLSQNEIPITVEQDDSYAYKVWVPNDYTLETFKAAGGIDLASYGREPMFQLYSDFDISAYVRGDEDWHGLLAYRRDHLKNPSLCFYVDKVARKRWLPSQGIHQPKVHVLNYDDELLDMGLKLMGLATEEYNLDDDEFLQRAQAESIYDRMPRPQNVSEGTDVASYAGKPTHMSMTKGTWLIDHYYNQEDGEEVRYSRNGRAIMSDHEEHELHPRDVAYDLAGSLREPAAEEESWALHNVRPGVVIEERWVSHEDPSAPPHEFCLFTIWGRLWLGQWNYVEENHRYWAGFIYRNGTFAHKTYRPEPGQDMTMPDWIPWDRLVAIAERLGANKDMFRTDMFVGRPADADPDSPLQIAVSESEIFPTTTFNGPDLPNEGARLWIAGYVMGMYELINNTEVPEDFMRNGKLPADLQAA